MTTFEDVVADLGRLVGERVIVQVGPSGGLPVTVFTGLLRRAEQAFLAPIARFVDCELAGYYVDGGQDRGEVPGFVVYAEDLEQGERGDDVVGWATAGTLIHLAREDVS